MGPAGMEMIAGAKRWRCAAGAGEEALGGTRKGMGAFAANRTAPLGKAGRSAPGRSCPGDEGGREERLPARRPGGFRVLATKSEGQPGRKRDGWPKRLT